jgi:hypothetical protein
MNFDQFANEDCNALVDELKVQAVAVGETLMNGKKIFTVHGGAAGSTELLLDCGQLTR